MPNDDGNIAMTTIAYRDNEIACDSGSSIGDSHVGEITKVVRNSSGDLAGAAGSAAYCHQFREWFCGGESGAAPKAEKADDSIDRGAIFRANGSLQVFEPRGMCEYSDIEYWAFGSGRPEALGAMHHGATAAEAVAAAIAHDASTHGKIIVLRRSQ